MTEDYDVRDTCRLCGEKDLELVLRLADTPPANELSEEPIKCTEVYPLYLVACTSCLHVQLPVSLPPNRLFSNYVYVSGTSPTFVRHFSDYSDYICDKNKVCGSEFVLEIGSNDGTMLKFFRDRGCRILGVDPAREIAAEANLQGISTLPVFFSEKTSDYIKDFFGQPDVIVANNVFAHVDGMSEFSSSIVKTLKDGGKFYFEVSYLRDVLEKTLFDTIYHEHVSYHHLSPLIPFFARLGCTVTDVARVPTHGGSLRVEVTKIQAGIPEHVKRFLDIEKQHIPVNFESLKQKFSLFQRNIDNLRNDLKKYLLTNQHKKIIGYGAPAKATTLLHHFNIKSDSIPVIVDDSKWKQNLHVPGKGIKIVSNDYLIDNEVDEVLILAWNFSDPIVKKLLPTKVKRALIPVPSFSIVDLDELRGSNDREIFAES